MLHSSTCPTHPFPPWHPSPAGQGWPCAACTFLNPPTFLACSVCGTARTQPAAAAGAAAAAAAEEEEEDWDLDPAAPPAEPMSLEEEEGLAALLAALKDWLRKPHALNDVPLTISNPKVRGRGCLMIEWTGPYLQFRALSGFRVPAALLMDWSACERCCPLPSHHFVYVPTPAPLLPSTGGGRAAGGVHARAGPFPDPAAPSRL